MASHSHNLLSCTKHRIGVLRSSKKWFVQLSSKMTFLQKSSNTWNICLCIAKTVHFIRKNNFSCSWALLLKLHLATFSDWKEALSILASHSHNLLSCTKHRIGVLRSSKEVILCLSSKMTFSAKKLKHVKICLLHCKKLFISLERNIFMYWALLLKLHLATFSDWERSFWAFVASHSHNCLVCTKHRIGVLRSSKKCFVQLSSKMTFSAKKLKHVKICLLHCKKLFISLERNIFHVVELALKIAFRNFSDWERSFWASVASHSHNCLVALNTELVFLEALKKWFCALSSKNYFSQKSSNSWKSVLLHCKKQFHFIRKIILM